MRYLTLWADCHRCGRMFTSNPSLVPSMRDANGIKQPLCEPCVRAIQSIQRERGLEVWPDPLPGAYEPLDTEAELWESDE